MTLREMRRVCEIIARHVGDDAHIMDSRHEVLWLCDGAIPFTSDERAELESLGARYDASSDAWKCFP